MNLDFSPFDIQLELTYNERRLILELLQSIPVNQNSLAYQCAKSIMEQIIEKLRDQEKKLIK